MNNSVETKKADVRRNIENVFGLATKKIKDIISVCPNWRVENVAIGYKGCRVDLDLMGIERYRELVIRYQAKIENFQEECFETDVPNCGSFALLDENDDLKYYAAIGDILNHKDMLSLLKETMVYYTNRFSELREEYRKLDQEA